MKVVLIDDNETVNFYNEGLLQETKAFEEIIVIENGTKAIKYFNSLTANNLPDIIFIDIKMPDYSGFEVLQEIEEMDKDFLIDIPTYILTTSQHKRDLETFEKFPMALGYIEKPLQENKLKEIIDLHLNE